MRLIACHIENFGKLSNLSVEFSEGINVINESNAWGKSTLAAFLKAMFYGLDAKKDPKAFDKERNIYRPWQGGAFGGELDFEVEGRIYRISRSFGRTEKQDEFHLYDLSTNLECEDYTEEIGVELFELDSASFKRSIYIAQNDCASAASDSINAKLGNLAENTDDINNFEATSSRMKALLLQLTPDRVTGSIKKRKGLITQMEQEIRTFDSAEEGLQGVKAMEAKTQERIQEMQNIRKDYAAALVIASDDARRKELYAQYDALVQDVEAKEQVVESFKSVFPTTVPSKQELEEQTQNARLLEEAKIAIRNQSFTPAEQESWNALKDMFAEDKPSDERIDAAISMLTEVDKQKEEIARQEATLSMYDVELDREVEMPKFGSGHKVFIALSIGLILAGAGGYAAYYFKWIAGISATMITIAAGGTAGLGLLFLIIGVLLAIQKKNAKRQWIETTEAEREELENQFTSLASAIKEMKENVRQVNATIGEFLGNYHVYCEVKDYQSRLYELKSQVREFERLETRQNSLMAEEGNTNRLQTAIMTFAKEYQLAMDGDIASTLAMLTNKATECKMAEQAYTESVKRKEAFEQRQDKSFWTREIRCPYSVMELNHMIEEADKSIEELKVTRAQYGKQLEDLQEQLDLRDEKLQELAEMRENQERDIRTYNLVSVTHDFLQKAKEQLTARYMEPIAKGFSKYYQMLTGDDRGEWMIDANINLKVREYGELRETKWLSAGYQDLIGVCIRLALVDAMYTEEKPFLILDDPFVNLDQEKVDCGNQLLLSVSEEYQVIYFTCHDSRSPVH